MEENSELNDPIALLIRTEGAGRGSGFFVGENLIATNIHVVAGATSISAELVEIETKFVVEGITAFDPKNDLVILKVQGEGPPLSIGDSDLVRNGDIVQAVGYPRGKYKVTEGPIHSIRDSDKWIRMKFKTIDGSSGSPVLNGNGEVIGIAVADADYFTFAIPANAVKMLLAPFQAVEPLVKWQKRKQIQAYAYLRRSKTNLARVDYDDAIADLDKAIQLNPNCFPFYYSRGFAKFLLGQSKPEKGSVAEAHQHYQDAIDDYTEVIKLCPDHAVAFTDRGAAKSNLGQPKANEGNFAGAQQHYRDAIVDYTEAIKLCVNLAIAYNNRAQVKLLHGISEVRLENIEAAEDIWKEAIIDSNTSIELSPDIAVFHHTRGQIKVVLLDFSAAIPDYDRAIEIDPNYTDACEELERVKDTLEQMEE